MTLNLSGFMVGAAAFCFIAGCSPDQRDTLEQKLGERNVSALQDIARDRRCLPIADIQSIRRMQDDVGQIEFLLRDGTRWINTSVPLDCQVPSPLVLAVKPDTTTLCADDQVRLLQPNAATHVDLGLCKLTRFQRR